MTEGVESKPAPAMSIEWKLCQGCREITLQNLIESDVIYHMSRDELLASASACPLCNLLLDGLRKEYAVENSLLDDMDVLNSFDNYTPSFQGIPREEDRAVVLSLKPFLKPPISQRPKTVLEPMEAVYFAWAQVSKDLANNFSHPRLEPLSNYLLMSAEKG